MKPEPLANRIIATWRRHNEILLYLVDKIPAKGFKAIPAESRGRDVGAQLAHLDRVRVIWLAYHLTGKRVKPPRAVKGFSPGRAQLRKSLRASGKEVERFLARSFEGEVKPRLFGGDSIRWLGYLIAHESHHRGQVMLALKQSGMRMPDKVAIEGLWGKWMMGK